MTLTKLADSIQKAKISSREICERYLQEIDRTESKVGAFIHLDREQILADADAADARRAKGNSKSPYDGLPIALKDNITAKGQPCRCASRILDPFVSPYNATVVERLLAKGMIIFGRTNMDEFAMGSSCENSAYQITRNPWNTERVPGGSSGGSAAAVAAGEVPAALGSDTGGSIRQPASFCGVVGIKPSYGLVSRYGLVAFASSLDQIGPVTTSVEDAALLLDIICGHDPMDASSLPVKSGNFFDELRNSGDDLKGVKIGLPKEYFAVEGLDDDVRKIVENSLEIMCGLGAEPVEISLPHSKYAVAAYYVIATAEASANLARFDGIRFGARTENTEDLIQTYFQSRGCGFGKEVKRRILLGTFVLSSGYYDAYYLRAQKVRTLIRRDFEKAFDTCDVILSPVSPTPAFKIGENTEDPLQMYLADIYTIALNLAGFCGTSIPADIHPQTKTPVGIQLIGPALGENKILRISQTFEQNRKQPDFIPEI